MKKILILLFTTGFFFLSAGQVYAQAAAENPRDFDALVQEIETLQRYRLNLLSVCVLLQRRAEVLSAEIEREKETGSMISHLFLPGRMQTLHLLLNQIEGLDSEVMEAERLIRERYAETLALLGGNPPREILDFLDLISGERLRRIRQVLESLNNQLKGLQGEQREAKRQEMESLRRDEEKAFSDFAAYYNR